MPYTLDIGPRKYVALAMRASVGVVFAAGLVLIIVGCVLQNPPKSWPNVCMVVLGSLTLFAALIGLWGSFNKKRILVCYLVFGGVVVILQIVWDVLCFLIFDKMLDAFEPVDTTDYSSRHSFANKLSIFRWIALGFIFVEVLSLSLAIFLKAFVPDDSTAHFTNFDEQTNERRALTMTSLRSDIEKNAARNPKYQERAYDKLRAKMAQKYGQFSQATDWKAKFGRR